MRQFLAIPLPDGLINHISEFLNPLRGMKGLKLVHPGNLHLTLLFLGDTGNPEKYSELRKIRFTPFTLTTTCIRFYPERKPRLIWIEIDESSELEDLYRKIAMVFLVEERLKAHITLARLKLLLPKNYGFIEEKIDHANPFVEKFEVNSFNLYNSELRPEGPVYRIGYRFQASR